DAARGGRRAPGGGAAGGGGAGDAAQGAGGPGAAPPPIEHGARDAGLPTGQRDAVQFLGTPHDAQPHREYALVEGHRFLLPQSAPWRGTDSGKDRTDRLLLVPSLSTLLRVGTCSLTWQACSTLSMLPTASLPSTIRWPTCCL